MSGRRLTTAITLVVLALVLGAMALVGVRQLTSPLPHSSVGKKACTGTLKQVRSYLTRGEVQVSVFNASGRTGLAASTLAKLEAAGFRPGNAGNAPSSAQVRRAVVWTTRPNDPAAKLVAVAFGPHTRVEVTSTDLGPGIDVLVGDRFSGLDHQSERRLRLATPIETCVPVG